MNQNTDFIEIITPYITDLYVMSETDAELVPFVWANLSTEKPLSIPTILTHLEKEKDIKVEMITLEKFFSPLVKIHKGDDEDTIATANQFKDLQKKLTETLTEINVLRTGEIEIDVYIIGKNAQNQYAGLQTFVVET
ncbi:MAG: hypothetical protein EAZ85_04180 [Bacteroidetes bacterium]|nr:MAG: hypothetical protein EAZ85_04180 [Bacteroidota bacterium]TAG85824.1 MAG: hypothetical protein EAZ20_14120 [Bacteroidota bacterium]